MPNMKLVYRMANTMFLILGMLFSMFLSWAGIGTREGIRQAIATNPYGIFFGRLAIATFIMLLYSVLIYGINRFIFRKIGHPAKIFQVSIGAYFVIVILYVC